MYARHSLEGPAELQSPRSTTGAAFASQASVPSVPAFVALLEAFRATGGTVPGNVLGQTLRGHQSACASSLAQLIATGRVFGFGWQCSFWIPMFQFNAADLSVNHAARQVRAALPLHWSGWAVASWFAAPCAQLQRRAPADVLGGDPGAVLATVTASQRAAGRDLPQPLRKQERTPAWAAHW